MEDFLIEDDYNNVYDDWDPNEYTERVNSERTQEYTIDYDGPLA